MKNDMNKIVVKSLQTDFILLNHQIIPYWEHKYSPGIIT